jgi:starch phosphorylase
MKTETEKGMTLVETQKEGRLVSARQQDPTSYRNSFGQYGCGPVQFTGTNDALYERHLVFDNVMDAAAIGARERFEASRSSVRDVLFATMDSNRGNL